MKKEEDKQKKASKKRNANVSVVAEEKNTQEDVHVNAYFEKNDTRRKAKSTAKKSTKEAASPKTESKIKSETKKPASFSKTSQPKVAVEVEKKETKDNDTAEEVAPEKVETKVEKLEPEEKKAETNKEAKLKKAEPKEKKSVETSEEFETLKLNTEAEQAESKIILRDVAKPIEAVEEKVKLNEPAAMATPAPAEVPVANTSIAEAPVKQPRKSIAPTAKQITRPTAKEIKEKEIKKALQTATKLPESNKKRKRKSAFDANFGWPRMVLAIACAATAVFAIAYFINLTSVDMSLKVAAMQSGIEASYPSYVPRGYNLSDVTSSNGKVTMNFKTDEGAFSISEENTAWDSDALLSNYVKPTYGDDYTVVREQGLTLFMGDTWEAWVNGGILYKLTVKTGSLTKKQMKTIATSL